MLSIQGHKDTAKHPEELRKGEKEREKEGKKERKKERKRERGKEEKKERNNITTEIQIDRKSMPKYGARERKSGEGERESVCVYQKNWAFTE